MEDAISSTRLEQLLLYIIELYDPEEDYEYLKELVYMEFNVSVSESLIKYTVSSVVNDNRH